MIRYFGTADGRLHELSPGTGTADAAIWFDLNDPTPDERAETARILGITLPTREEMEEIELSSRLYHDNGTAFMTAMLPGGVAEGMLVLGPVTFALVTGRLVTLRFHTPKPFETFPKRAEQAAAGCATGDAVLLGLLEEIVDRLADLLELVGREIEQMSRRIFGSAGGTRPAPRRPKGKRDLSDILSAIGREAQLLSYVQDSLVSLERVLGFLAQEFRRISCARDVESAQLMLTHDVRSLIEHAAFMSQKITFLLDATLGLINIEQNGIIKVVSVAAVAFLPPTLIASVYGMNFDHMPELASLWGYPAALGAMAVSAVVPLWVMRRIGWL